jgi:hypothetical protein
MYEGDVLDDNCDTQVESLLSEGDVKFFSKGGSLTVPYKLRGKGATRSLDLRSENRVEESPFVKMLATRSNVEIYFTDISPLITFSLTKW